jgi:hypothetical protein
VYLICIFFARLFLDFSLGKEIDSKKAVRMLDRLLNGFWSFLVRKRR